MEWHGSSEVTQHPVLGCVKRCQQKLSTLRFCWGPVMGTHCLACSQVPDTSHPHPTHQGLANHIVGTDSPGTRSPLELVAVGTLPKSEPPGTSRASRVSRALLGQGRPAGRPPLRPGSLALLGSFKNVGEGGG